MAKTPAHCERSRSLWIQFRYHVFRPRRQASSGLRQGGYARSFPTYPLLNTPILVQNWPRHTMRILKNSPGPAGPRIHPQEAWPERRGPRGPHARSSAARCVPHLSPILGPFITVWATWSAKCRSTCPEGGFHTPRDPFDHVY